MSEDRSFLLRMPRCAGVLLHVSSLPSDFGIGDFGSAALDFIDRLARAGISVWQVLPLGPTAYGNSPYQPISAFALNPLLIAPDLLLQEGLLNADEIRPLASLPADTVDYDRLIPLKTGLLDLAAQRFLGQSRASARMDFEAFLEANDQDWLHDFARFRWLKSAHGERAWPEWEPSFRRRDSAALQRLDAQQHASLQAIKVVQFFADRQWRQLRQHAQSLGIRLFGDMPIYLALDSADAWARPELLQIDRDGQPSAVAGVPPDYFSRDGQLWGNPLYDWGYHASDQYRWWRLRMRHALQQFDLLRIDHFRGFESYWSVPAGAQTAREGEWLPGPGDQLFAALGAEPGELPLVAEDLGLITEAVRALRDRLGMPGMVVLQFALADPQFSLEQVEESSVVYTGTHDNDTVAGWFAGDRDDTRSPAQRESDRQLVLQRTAGTAATVSQDVLRLALSTAARLVVAPLQDFLSLGSEARMNRPGTTDGNWRWRTARHDSPCGFNEAVAAHCTALLRCSGRISLD